MNKADEVSDALVDTYRAFRAINEADRGRVFLVPGAGVDPRRVIRPSNRVKNAWRHSGRKVSLRAFARQLRASGSDVERGAAARWLHSKGAR